MGETIAGYDWMWAVLHVPSFNLNKSEPLI